MIMKIYELQEKKRDQRKDRNDELLIAEAQEQLIETCENKRMQYGNIPPNGVPDFERLAIDARSIPGLFVQIFSNNGIEYVQDGIRTMNKCLSKVKYCNKKINELKQTKEVLQNEMEQLKQPIEVRVVTHKRENEILFPTKTKIAILIFWIPLVLLLLLMNMNLVLAWFSPQHDITELSTITEMLDLINPKVTNIDFSIYAPTAVFISFLFSIIPLAFLIVLALQSVKFKNVPLSKEERFSKVGILMLAVVIIDLIYNIGSNLRQREIINQLIPDLSVPLVTPEIVGVFFMYIAMCFMIKILTATFMTLYNRTKIDELDMEAKEVEQKRINNEIIQTTKKIKIVEQKIEFEENAKHFHEEQYSKGFAEVLSLLKPGLEAAYRTLESTFYQYCDFQNYVLSDEEKTRIKQIMDEENNKSLELKDLLI